MNPSSFLSAVALNLLVLVCASAQVRSEVMIDTSFDASEAESLIVSVLDADVAVLSGTEGDISVVVSISGKDLAKGREYFEQQNFDVRIDDNAIRISSDRQGRQFWNNWRNTPDIDVRVQIPESFTVGVRTSDGSVSINRLQGDLHIKTLDGDIAVGSVDGYEVELRTSDGDIVVESVDGESVHAKTLDGGIVFGDVQATRVVLSTSDGDISLESVAGALQANTLDGSIAVGSVNGRTVELRTSDGDIAVESADGESIHAKTLDGDITFGDVQGARISSSTSDGDISMNQVEGSVTVSALDGDITLALVSPGTVDARSTNGNVNILLSGKHAANLQLSGNAIDIESGLEFSGRIQEKSANGQVNGGGDLIQARSIDGTVRLRALRR